jgi:hypothetical protein
MPSDRDNRKREEGDGLEHRVTAELHHQGPNIDDIRSTDELPSAAETVNRERSGLESSDKLGSKNAMQASSEFPNTDDAVTQRDETNSEPHAETTETQTTIPVSRETTSELPNTDDTVTPDDGPSTRDESQVKEARGHPVENDAAEQREQWDLDRLGRTLPDKYYNIPEASNSGREAREEFALRNSERNAETTASEVTDTRRLADAAAPNRGSRIDQLVESAKEGGQAAKEFAGRGVRTVRHTASDISQKAAQLRENLGETAHAVGDKIGDLHIDKAARVAMVSAVASATFHGAPDFDSANKGPASTDNQPTQTVKADVVKPAAAAEVNAEALKEREEAKKIAEQRERNRDVLEEGAYDLEEKEKWWHNLENGLPNKD